MVLVVSLTAVSFACVHLSCSLYYLFIWNTFENEADER